MCNHRGKNNILSFDYKCPEGSQFPTRLKHVKKKKGKVGSLIVQTLKQAQLLLIQSSLHLAMPNFFHLKKLW